MTGDFSRLTDWVGRVHESYDTVTAGRMAAFAALLDRDEPWPEVGDPLPPGSHWLFFHDTTRQSELGPDGHPRRGRFFPDVPLPRRMWAGSRIAFPGVIRVGDAIVRRSEIMRVEVKEGRSGTLVFVGLRHAIGTADYPALVEEQDLVYRAAPRAGEVPPAPRTAPHDAAFGREVRPDPVLLFRYSALTFNSHRIHYDAPYATTVEGYPGLVVHGPLTATLLLDLCRRQAAGRNLASFTVRALAPLFVTAPFRIAGRLDGGGVALWAETPDGATAMLGEGRFV